MLELNPLKRIRVFEILQQLIGNELFFYNN